MYSVCSKLQTVSAYFSNIIHAVVVVVVVVVEDFSSIFKRIPPFSQTFLTFGRRDVFAKRQRVVDESVHNFFSRRFGGGLFSNNTEVRWGPHFLHFNRRHTMLVHEAG